MALFVGFLNGFMSGFAVAIWIAVGLVKLRFGEATIRVELSTPQNTKPE